ncbi:MAG: hypothetical protein JWN86_13, partial [Planctomycetota bacterium]|nr:hypothetical protein [Planctomycetota bacterium]
MCIAILVGRASRPAYKESIFLEAGRDA